MMALPAPQEPGNVSALRALLNLDSADDWALCFGWLIGPLRPEGSGPYPILALHGGEGSSKTSATKMLRQCVDPVIAEVRSMFRDERDLAIAAKRSWVLAFDNVSVIDPWQSDALCRLATGAAWTTRKLHTDEDEVVFKFARPVILNGIESLAERADLASRTIVLELPFIPEDRRKLESELWSEYRRLHPAILGGLCDAVAEALRNQGLIKLRDLPRMADFAVWVATAEAGLTLKPGEFLRAYIGNRETVSESTVDSDDVARAVRDFVCVHRHGQEWTGPATALLGELLRFVDEREKAHSPKNGSALSKRLIRVKHVLRSRGIDLARERGKGRSWTVRQTPNLRVDPVAPDAPMP